MRQYRWQDNGKPPYAARFHKKKWEKHKEEIKLLHAEGRTKNQIIEALGNQHGFRPSYGQLRRRLDRRSPKTTRSIDLSSPPTSLSQRPPDPSNPCLESFGLQPSEKEISLTKDEEGVFRMFTTILDEVNEVDISLGKAPSIDTNRGSGLGQQQAEQSQISASNLPDTTPSDDQPAPPTTADIPQPTPNQASFAEIAVDSDDDFTSKYSKEFEESSTELWPQTRERRHDHRQKGLNPDISRTERRARRRTARVCCACGKKGPFNFCKSCQHKRCSGC